MTLRAEAEGLEPLFELDVRSQAIGVSILRYRRGTDCDVRCVQMVHGEGRIGLSGRTRTSPMNFGGGGSLIP